MSRISRRDLLAGAAVGAVGLGVGLWARLRQPAPAAGATDALWRARFPVPGQRATVDLARWRGQPVVLNFWAPWCPPCVRELPQFDRFQREFAAQGWQVLGIAIDSEAAVLQFLQRTPVSYPVGLAGLEGSELMTALGNSAGGLPFTVVLDREGRVARTHLGETHFTDLQQWASADA